MEKIITRTIICLSLTLLTLSISSNLVWGDIANPGPYGSARAEYIFQPSPTSSDHLNTVQGHVERGNNPLSGPNSWTWMAVSMSQITPGEDCHTGNVASSSYLVVRAGWMKYHHPLFGNGDQPYMIAAWKTWAGTQIAKYIPFNQMYPMKIREAFPAGPEHWWFQRYRSDTSAWETFACIGCGLIPGIHPPFKCASYGGWASASSHDLGNVAIQYPIYRSTQTGGTYYNVPLPNEHGVLATQYRFGFALSPVPMIQVQDAY